MATQPVTLTIPDGTFPGMEMSVEWGGVSYSVAVPEGSGPGEEITVELPSLEEGPPAGRPLATNEYEMVGRRAELVGLVAHRHGHPGGGGEDASKAA